MKRAKKAQPASTTKLVMLSAAVTFAVFVTYKVATKQWLQFT